MDVTHNQIINAISKAEDVSLFIARARAITLGNGETPCKEQNEQSIEIEAWIDILLRCEVDQESGCIDDDDIWNIIHKVNEMYRETDCATSQTYSRNSSSGGGSIPPSGYVERVLGVNVDNSNPSRPVVEIFVDGVTITGNGTEGDPFVAVGGGGSSVWGSITGTLSNQTDLQNALTARELIANKSTNVVTDQASNTKYPSVKAVFDWATSTFTTAAAVAVQIASALVGYATEAWVTSQNYLVKNATITGATKTKITYDDKGLVTSGADATTADIADSTDRRYVTDAQLVVIGNTSGTNTGDQNLFSKIAVSGQSDVVADSTTDTLTLVAGANVTITTDATTDSITISAAGGAGTYTPTLTPDGSVITAVSQIHGYQSTNGTIVTFTLDAKLTVDFTMGDTGDISIDTLPFPAGTPYLIGTASISFATAPAGVFTAFLQSNGNIRVYCADSSYTSTQLLISVTAQYEIN